MQPVAAPADVAFVLAHTSLARVAAVPEVRMHLAGDPFELWAETAREVGPALPFWAFAWAGGQALARRVLDRPGTVAGRSVLDVGSGGGLVAIACALAGATSVVPSEVDRLALAAIGLNAAANGVALAACAGDLLDTDCAGFDVVLAGDLFYERALAERVVPFLERARRRGADVLVGDPGRAYLPAGRFEAVATVEVPTAGALEDADVKPATVWRMR